MKNGKNILRHLIKDDGEFPNNNKLPLLLYPQVFEIDLAGDIAAGFEALFLQSDWVNSWRNGVYAYHHYHSTAHEVLGVYRGNAVIQFGGNKGITVMVQKGDAVVIPAGVAHKKLSSSTEFAVVGAYPLGQRWDMNYGRREERPQVDINISNVGLPKQDPVFGVAGLPEIWTGR